MVAVRARYRANISMWMIVCKSEIGDRLLTGPNYSRDQHASSVHLVFIQIFLHPTSCYDTPRTKMPSIALSLI